MKFQTDDLCGAETDDEIRTILRNLPKDLVETYDRFLGRVEGEQRREYIKRMFQWIVCARRPLMANELREGIAFTTEDNHFDTAKLPNDLQRLTRACGNLISIDEDTEEVHLAHYTVQQYLLERKRPSFFRLTQKSANIEVRRLCLTYLHFADFETQITPYRDNVTPALSSLEKAIGIQALMLQDSTGAGIARMLRKARGTEYSPTGTDYSRPFQDFPINRGTSDINTKYELLSYITENWLHHTKDFMHGIVSEQDTERFQQLALVKKFLFNIRPWEGIKVVAGIDYYTSEGLHFAIEMGWAISNNHMPLLRAVHQQLDTEITGFLAVIDGCSKRYISEDHLIETSPMNPPPPEISS